MTIEINLLALLHQAKAGEENSPVHGKSDKEKHQKTIVTFKKNTKHSDARYTDSSTPSMGTLYNPPKKDKP